MRRRISLFSRSWGQLNQICRQISRGEAAKASSSCRGGVEVFGRVREALGERGHDAVELGDHGVGVGLVEDGADLGSDVRLGGLGYLSAAMRAWPAAEQCCGHLRHA